MKVTATVAEYNPIHKGHEMHLSSARHNTGADRVIAVMSGDFVQRGCPAVISKYERAGSALAAGADLVLELPVCYSTGSMEYFARGSVSLLQKTGVVDCISFGSECGDISLLKEAASLTGSLDDKQNEKLKDLLAEGVNYSNAINSVIPLPSHITELLKSPNNLLGVAYIKAAYDLDFECDFHTMKRFGSAYHDDSKGALSSTALRKELLAGGCGLCEDDFSLLLFYKLQSVIEGSATTGEAASYLTSYLDVSASLAGKIINKYKHASSFSSLSDELKSRDLNHARINRALIHILLDIKKAKVNEYISGGYNYYIKPLGFKKEATDLLHEIKKRASVPLISKNADASSTLYSHYLSDDAKESLDGHNSASAHLCALEMFSLGIKSSDLYNKTACTIGKRPFISEYERSVITL